MAAGGGGLRCAGSAGGGYRFLECVVGGVLDVVGCGGMGCDFPWGEEGTLELDREFG